MAGATGGEQTAGPALYAQFGCAGCHGGQGEGGAGPALRDHEWTAAKVNAVIRNGQGNMLALKAGTLSDADLAAVVTTRASHRTG